MSLADRHDHQPDAGAVQRRLERAERLLALNELLVAGLIHDLRTPLMAINLSAEVALVRTTGDDAVQQAARRIKTSSERMARIFDHVLNLSRVGAEVPGLDLRPGDLGEAAEDVLAGLRAADSGITFEVTREGDLGGVFDPALIRRAIANVLETSLHYVDETRTVMVQLDGKHRDRMWVRVSVPGVIPPDVQESMFVPGPVAAGLEVPGIGLGLHEIDPFLRAHGGSVVGRSRAPAGTVFELLLPRNARDAA